MKSCAGRFEALGGQSWIPYKWQLMRPKLPVLALGVSQLSPSFDLKSQAAHEKLCGALWSIGRAVLDPLEVTAFAAKTACTCPWRVTAVSKLWPKVASCPWKAVRAVLDPLEMTASAAKTACTCPWRVTAVSKLWPKVASCPWKAVRGALKRWEGSPGSLRNDSFGGQNCLYYLPLECHSCLQALTHRRKLPMKSCAGPFEALGTQSWIP